MSRPVPRFAVVIPAYNEAGTVRAVAAGALAHAPLVIVVDDGSADGTTERLHGLPITVLRHPENRGKAAALRLGIEHALTHGVEAVVSLDADGQHRPEDIPRLLRAARRAPGHIVIGARLRARVATPLARRLGHVAADFWIGWAAGVPIRDTQSGFRLYPAGLLRDLDLPHGPRRSFVFESEALIEAARRGYGIVWIRVDAIYGRNPRQSYYRGVFDTTAIVAMVATKLLSRGLHPLGLLRSLGLLGRQAGAGRDQRESRRRRGGSPLLADADAPAFQDPRLRYNRPAVGVDNPIDRARPTNRPRGGFDER